MKNGDVPYAYDIKILKNPPKGNPNFSHQPQSTAKNPARTSTPKSFLFHLWYSNLASDAKGKGIS